MTERFRLTNFDDSIMKNDYEYAWDMLVLIAGTIYRVIEDEKTFIIIMIVCFCSCSAIHQNNASFYTYQSVGNGVSVPTFITLKKFGRTFEIYSPTMQITTVGMWKTKDDTLIFTPSLDYTVENEKLYIEHLNDTIKTVTSIPKRYLIKGEELIDITDYRQIYSEFMGDEQPVSSQYKKMK